MGRRRTRTITAALCAALVAAACAPLPGGGTVPTGPVGPDHLVHIRLSGAYTYETSGPVTGGDLVVARDDHGAPAGIEGTVTIPGRGADPATVTFDLDISPAVGVASGTIDVVDPVAGLAATTQLVLSPTTVGAGTIDGTADWSRIWRLVETRPFRLEWSVTDGTGTAPAAPALPVATSGSLDVVTYNVAGLPEPLSGSRPTVNSALLSPLLDEYDIALLQEDFFYLPEVAGSLTYPYGSPPQRLPLGSDPTRPSAFVGSGLERYARHPFSGYTQQRWPGCYGGALGAGAADCLSQKGFSVARHQVAAGVWIDVYDLHAEAGSSPDDEYWSAQDYLTLAAYINAQSAGHAVIVGGDFNLHKETAVDGAVLARFLSETGLSDVCDVQDCSADPNVIDRILFRSGDDVTLDATAWWRPPHFVDAAGEPLSDHDPTAATIGWSIGG